MKSNHSLLTLVKEPLLQFLLLGLLIFAIDLYISKNKENPYKIYVGDKKINELISIFEEGQGRLPSTKEIENMIVQWTQNEMMFREGHQLNLHQGDEMIRNRLILKMRNILLNNVVVAKPSDEELQSWYKRFEKQYQIPAQVSIKLIANNNSKNSEDEVKDIANSLNIDNTSTNGYIIRTYENRPLQSLYSFLEPDTVDQLVNSPIDKWLPVQTTSKQWQIAKVINYSPEKAPDFSSIKIKLLKDWQKFSKDEQLALQTKNIIDSYDIIVEPSKELLDKYQINYASSN